MHPKPLKLPNPRPDNKPRYLPFVVREMGGEDERARVPCLDHHAIDVCCKCDFHVLGNWTSNWGLESWEVGSEEMERTGGELVEGFEVGLVARLEGVEVEVGWSSREG
jgi:hypothetical protein